VDQYSSWILSAYITALLGALWRSQGNTAKEIKALLQDISEREHQCQLKNAERFGTIERTIEKVVTVQGENVKKHEKSENMLTLMARRIDEVCIGDGK
jgi:translation initiation factor IF-3